MSIKKIFSTIWYAFGILCTLFLVYAVITFFLTPTLKVNVNTIKKEYDDYSVFWVENKEEVKIELTEVEINGEYILKDFPSDKDYLNPDISGRGKQFIKPGEKVIFLTKYFHNSDGKKFDYHSLVFTKIMVWAEVDGDTRFFHAKPR